MMTIGSLFAGIGGIELGLEMTEGFKTLWQVEIDSYAQKVLRLRFPESELFEDVRLVGKDNLKRVDLLCGGFPCQDISNAGKRKGIEGERSGLWSEFFRIICEIRPRYVLVENVAALLGRGFGRVLGDLASCGYDAEWDCLPSAAFGAPHLRDRLFLVGYTKGKRLVQTKIFKNFLPESNQENKFWRCSSPLRLEIIRRTFRGIPENLRMDDGVSLELDRLKCLGNAVVPQIAFWIGQRILEREKGND